MNKTLYSVVILFVAVLVALLGLIWWGERRIDNSHGGAALLPSSSNTSTVATQTTTVNHSVPAADQKAQAMAQRLSLFEHVWATANGRDLTFYGKVIDQDGNPVPGAEVHAYVMKTLGFQGTSETPSVTSADNNGNFEFRGLRGKRMGIVPKKAGYLFEQRGNGNWTEDYKPSSDNRVIFKMWRQVGVDMMVHSHLQDAIPCDASIQTYSFRTGQRVNSGGEFVINFTRNPVNIVRGKHFDWTLTLSVPSGGLIPENDIYPYKAPASGYQPSVTISMPVSAHDWSPEFSQSYYFHNGTAYGRITIQFTADYQPPPTFILGDIYENPAGRNLEFDPFKRL